MTKELNLPINTLIQGDCVEKMNELPEKCVDLIFADPPYFLQLKDDLYRPNQTKVDAVDDNWDEFASFEEYDKFTKEWLTAAKRVMKDNSTIWVMGSYTNIFRVGVIMQDLGFWILNQVEWIKDNPTPNFKGSRFCNAQETLIWAAKSSNQKKYTFNYKASKAANDDKQLRSDWYFPICSGSERLMGEDGKKGHSTQKPECLMRRIINTTTNPDDIILDPFSGSATTCAVAKKLGRNFIGIDLEEKYITLGQKRLDSIDGSEANDVIKGSPLWASKPKVAFGLLLETGILKAGQKLRFYITPTKSTAEYAVVHEDGTITAKEVRGSIHGVGKLLLNTPSCNGWVHWYYFDEKVKAEFPIDDLRTLYLAQNTDPE